MDFFTALLVILFIAATVDLIVGVSNDAVNFLNSAIGSKVASLRTILVVASLGVIMGSMFSSGMMEIARNGLFNPSFFTFEQVMYLFLAVMLTDIILLDFYNSLGLPTSTTVSLVFELLGAAFAIGVLHSFTQGLSWNDISLDNILNFSSAFTIITGIFLSIFLAFIVGSLVQRLSRMIFTFSIKKSMKKYGAIFSGLSITIIIYFLLIKGVKGSTLVSDDQINWIIENTWPIVFGCLVFFSIVVQLIMWYTSINPLKVVVLLGTFSLAMAFAGNDLVNFIGVAIAGLSAFQNWFSSGVPADQYQMGALAQKLASPTWILLIAGLIMVITLWTNAKSRKVTETEVSLGRQDEGEEKFKPNMVSRLLVGFSLYVGKLIDTLLPRRWSKALEKRFSKDEIENVAEKDQPSFDLVRASVNLLVSSILIAYGTSQKLPLSTTFVTFMVAMGSSFADQAWGRESAVYRVAGVINVIAGWLITAVIAFSFSAFIAMLLFKTGTTGVISISALAGFLLVRSHIVFAKKEKKESADKKVFSSNLENLAQAIDESKDVTVKNIKMVLKVYSTSLDALAQEKRNAMEKSLIRFKELREQYLKLENKILKYVKKMPKRNLPASRLYILMFNYMQDLHQSIELISESCTEHMRNYHSTPTKEYLVRMNEIEKGLLHYTDLVCQEISSSKFKHYEDVLRQNLKWKTFIDQTIDEQISSLQKGDFGNRIGLLQMKLLLETKDIFATIQDMYNLYHDYHKSEN
jgi:phosphate/sulfate permease